MSVCILVPTACQRLRAAGLTVEIEDAGLRARRPTRPGRYVFERFVPYVDTIGSLVRLPEIEHVVTVATRARAA